MTEDPLTEFCATQHARLVGALTLYTGDADLARELAQEALARACLRWTRVAEMAAPGAWVHRVALNLANSHFRRRSAERAAHRRAGTEPAVRADDVDAALAVRRAVAGLPRRQRMALVLRYLSDLSVEETAAAMGCRPGTVKALTHQALATLRLRGDLEEEVATSDVR